MQPARMIVDAILEALIRIGLESAVGCLMARVPATKSAPDECPTCGRVGRSESKRHWLFFSCSAGHRWKVLKKNPTFRRKVG